MEGGSHPALELPSHPQGYKIDITQHTRTMGPQSSAFLGSAVTKAHGHRVFSRASGIFKSNWIPNSYCSQQKTCLHQEMSKNLWEKLTILAQLLLLRWFRAKPLLFKTGSIYANWEHPKELFCVPLEARNMLCFHCSFIWCTHLTLYRHKPSL